MVVISCWARGVMGVVSRLVAVFDLTTWLVLNMQYCLAVCVSMEKLRATNNTDVLVLLISEASRLMTRCRATELSVAAGLLVTTNCGEATSVAVTFMCRRRLLESLRGHPLVMLWFSLIPLNTKVIWLVCLVPSRLQRTCNGRVTRRVVATIGPSVRVGPRNIAFIHWFCRLVRIRLLVHV